MAKFNIVSKWSDYTDGDLLFCKYVRYTYSEHQYIFSDASGFRFNLDYEKFKYSKNRTLHHHYHLKEGDLYVINLDRCGLWYIMFDYYKRMVFKYEYQPSIDAVKIDTIKI